MNFRKEIENSKSQIKVQETKRKKKQRRVIPPVDTILLKMRSICLKTHPKVT